HRFCPIVINSTIDKILGTEQKEVFDVYPKQEKYQHERIPSLYFPFISQFSLIDFRNLFDGKAAFLWCNCRNFKPSERIKVSRNNPFIDCPVVNCPNISHI